MDKQPNKWLNVIPDGYNLGLPAAHSADEIAALASEFRRPGPLLLFRGCRLRHLPGMR